MVELTTLAASHGLGHLLAVVGLSRRKSDDGVTPLSTPERLRNFFTDAGTTFIKFGQRLSTRADLLPADYVEAFSTLQEHVPPAPTAELLEVVETEIGAPIDEMFSEISEEPVASASIGCVFRARLRGTGKQVALKVRRPGIRSQVAIDLAILQDVARRVERYVPSLRRYYPVQMVREFSDSLLAELDFALEARKTLRLSDAVESHPRVHVPEVMMELCTHKLLVTEWIEGIEPSDYEELERQGVERSALAHNLAMSVLRQAVEDGSFHADPHPGNLRITGDGEVYFLDIGNVCYIGKQSRDQLSRLLIAMFLERADQVVTVLINAGVVGPQVNIHLLQHDIDRSLAEHVSHRAKPNFGELIHDFFLTVHTYELGYLPPEWVTLLLSLGMAESTCRKLDPEFSLADIGRELAQRDLLDVQLLRHPAKWLRERILQAQGLSDLVRSVPNRLERILTQVESGGLRLRLQHDETERNITPFQYMVNRLALAILLGAGVLSGALMLLSQQPSVERLGVILLILSGVGVAVLLLAIFRSGGP